MANCASCGATSVEGASACGACGRPFAPPPPTAAPPPPTAALPVVPAAPAGPAAPAVPPAPGYAPPPPSGPPGPPATGSWGAGRPYDGQPPVQRLLAGPDWRPAFKAALAPTAVLLLAALIAAIPGDYQYEYRFRSPDFGSRFGAMLSMALSALGAPFKLGYQSPLSGGRAERMDFVFRVAPMTVTVLWCLALWYALRAGLRRRKAVTGQLTRSQAAGEALRTALVLAGVTTVIWAVGGTTQQPRDSFDVPDYPGTGQDLSRPVITAGSGWLEAVGWTVLLAGSLAFAVYGTDALRWAAWRSRSVRGWAVAALTAGRALGVSVGLSSLAGFVLVAANSSGGAETGVSLAFLPNLGLNLLGFGSGATFRAHSGTTGGETSWRDRGEDLDLSFFDLHDEVSADWRWAALLALFAAAVLGWTAYRRQLDAADRLRLAAVYAVALTGLMAVAGATMTRSSGMAGWSRTSDLEVSQENAVGLTFLTVLAANAVWAVVGALLVPPLLAAARGGGAGAPYAGAPYGPTPPPPMPTPTPAPSTARTPHGAPVPGVPAQGAPADDAPPALGAGSGVSEVLGSDEAPPASAAAPPAPAEAPRPAAEAPVDPSVWREHP